MLKPHALNHVGLKVADVDRSVRFYEILGLELLRRSDQGGNGAGSAVLKIGNQEINLFAKSDLAPAGPTETRGIDHFCLMMESAAIDDIIDALKQQGIAIASGPTKRRDGMSVFISDPDGIRVELQIKN